VHRMPLVAFVLFIATLLIAPAASAATGSIGDPAGESPDIRRLTYSNSARHVVMTMRYTRLADARFQSFYIHWDSPAYYQVQVTPKGKRLEFKAATRVACAGLRVTVLRPRQSTRVVVPRKCLRRADNRLRFRGIAARGLNADETSLSPWVRRG
jgi:hypothetical protein